MLPAPKPRTSVRLCSGPTGQQSAWRRRVFSCESKRVLAAKCLFLKTKDRPKAWDGGGGCRRGKQSLKQTPHPAQSQPGAQSHNPENMTRAEIKSWMLNRLNHPGTPEIQVLESFHYGKFPGKSSYPVVPQFPISKMQGWNMISKIASS